jgi:hypothetical protein
MADAVRIVANSYSLRYFGNGVDDIDRVKIPIDDPAKPVDVGDEDFTIEWWMKANLSENMNGVVGTGNDGWITGNILLDRDVYGVGDFGDYGVAMGRVGSKGVLAFGVNNGTSGDTIVGTRNVADGAWHHVAVMRRRSDGFLTLYVDGTLDAQVDGPNGNISYRDGRPTSFLNDPFLVLGAEKHDAGSAYPSFSGWMDEMRISNILRYTANFTVPTQPFGTDSATLGLYHFDEKAGDTIHDVGGAVGGPSNGQRKAGGNPFGPIWSNDTPFAGRSGQTGRWVAHFDSREVSAGRKTPVAQGTTLRVNRHATSPSPEEGAEVPFGPVESPARINLAIRSDCSGDAGDGLFQAFLPYQF